MLRAGPAASLHGSESQPASCPQCLLRSPNPLGLVLLLLRARSPWVPPPQAVDAELASGDSPRGYLRAAPPMVECSPAPLPAPRSSAPPTPPSLLSAPLPSPMPSSCSSAARPFPPQDPCCCCSLCPEPSSPVPDAPAALSFLLIQCGPLAGRLGGGSPPFLGCAACASNGARRGAGAQRAGEHLRQSPQPPVAGLPVPAGALGCGSHTNGRDAGVRVSCCFHWHPTFYLAALPPSCLTLFITWLKIQKHEGRGEDISCTSCLQLARPHCRGPAHGFLALLPQRCLCSSQSTQRLTCPPTKLWQQVPTASVPRSCHLTTHLGALPSVCTEHSLTSPTTAHGAQWASCSAWPFPALAPGSSDSYLF